MDQLSKINSKALPTTSQYLLKSVEVHCWTFRLYTLSNEARVGIYGSERDSGSVPRSVISYERKTPASASTTAEATVSLWWSVYLANQKNGAAHVLDVVLADYQLLSADQEVCRVIDARGLDRRLHSGRGPSRKGMLVVHLREF
jgi:hypothetical protein